MKNAPYVFLLAFCTFGGFVGGCHYGYRDAVRIFQGELKATHILPSDSTIGTATYRWSDKMPTTDLTGKSLSGVYHEKWQYVDGKMTILAPIVVVPFKGKAQ